jgi:hypothetical protein
MNHQITARKIEHVVKCSSTDSYTKPAKALDYIKQGLILIWPWLSRWEIFKPDFELVRYPYTATTTDVARYALRPLPKGLPPTAKSFQELTFSDPDHFF